MIRPRLAPSRKKYKFITGVAVCSSSVDSRYMETVISAVPTMGKTLYRPVRAMSWPLPIEVASMPSTIGSR
jgi:hypothetical protein